MDEQEQAGQHQELRSLELAGTKEGARRIESMTQDQDQKQAEDSTGKHERDSDLVGKQEYVQEKDTAEKF